MNKESLAEQLKDARRRITLQRRELGRMSARIRLLEAVSGRDVRDVAIIKLSRDTAGWIANHARGKLADAYEASGLTRDAAWLRVRSELDEEWRGQVGKLYPWALRGLRDLAVKARLMLDGKEHSNRLTASALLDELTAALDAIGASK